MLLKALADSWASYSGDLTGRRYSTVTHINQQTVRNLGLATVIQCSRSRSTERLAKVGHRLVARRWGQKPAQRAEVVMTGNVAHPRRPLIVVSNQLDGRATSLRAGAERANRLQILRLGLDRVRRSR